MATMAYEFVNVAKTPTLEKTALSHCHLSPDLVSRAQWGSGGTHSLEFSNMARTAMIVDSRNTSVEYYVLFVDLSK